MLVEEPLQAAYRHPATSLDSFRSAGRRTHRTIASHETDVRTSVPPPGAPA